MSHHTQGAQAMRVVYIAGPYGASTEAEITENVRRACQLGYLAAMCDLAPVVPHAMSVQKCYGTAFEEDGGFTRQLAVASGVRIAELIGEVGGALWVIQRADGSMSEGTRKEVDSYICVARGNARTPHITAMPWVDWERRIQQIVPGQISPALENALPRMKL